MARTLLQIVQDACSDIGMARPSVVASATLETPIRMLRILNKAGIQLQKEIAWNELLTVRTFTPVAAQAQVEPPSDYGRMSPMTGLWDVSLRRNAVGPISTDKWLELLTMTTTGGDKYWTLIAGKFNIYPVPAVTDSFNYAYQSKNWVVNGSSYKDAFDADDDEPRIDAELLTLELIWRWKSAIGLDYAEDMANANRQKEIVVAATRGPRILELSDPFRGDLPANYWPGVISP